MNDDDVRHALASQADRSLDVLSVQGRISAALDRRRRRQQAGAVVSVGLAITGLALGVHALQPSGDRDDGFASTGPSSGPSVPPSSSATMPPPTRPITLVSAGTTDSSSPVDVTAADLPQRARDAYFAHMPSDDCCSEEAHLATLWQVDAFDAKALAGQILLDGGTLSDVTASTFESNTAAFFDHGYTIADAEQLASLWQEPTQLLSVKAVAGQLIVHGKPLPIRPGQ